MVFTGELRPYQEGPVKRCVARGRMLLAMEQGTGKTPVTIAVLEALNEEFNDTLSGLIFAGSALRYQWRDEIAKFTGGTVDDKGRWSGGAPCVVIDGPNQAARVKQYRMVRKLQPQYVLLGYEQLLDDYEYVLKLPRDFLVGDEITAIKSPAAQRSQALKTLDAPFVFGLTGTPMENGKPDELFSIMEWIDPSVFGRADLFDRAFVSRNKYGRAVGYRNVPRCHAILSEAMVRVTKDDPEVAAFMPTKIPPKTHYVELEDEVAEVYRIIAGDLAAELSAAMQKKRSSFDVLALYSGHAKNGDDIQGRIAARIAALRMLLAHPRILVESAERYIATDGQHGSAYAASLHVAGVLGPIAYEPSVKLAEAVLRIDDVLNRAPENKIVVFSFFKGALQMLVQAYGAEAVQFHGGMTASAKAAAKRRFQHEADVRLFLSSDAGGYGVDLPQANWLINIDLPFSKGKSDQRNSRHDRVSSLHKQIHTETFLVSGSIEQFYADRLHGKGGVARAIIDGRGFNREGKLELSASTLLEFLEADGV